MNQHATDRWDWTLIAECPNNGDHIEGKTDPDDPEHLTLEASAECSKFKAREAVPIEECGICGADLDFVIEQQPTEILTDGGTSTGSGIERSAPAASDSRDSALQYVSFDLLESGFDADAQRELLEPVEDEIRDHLPAALRDGMRKALCSDPERGATYAIGYLKSKLTFEDVPEEHRDDIETLVTSRLDEKHGQLAEVYHDLREDALAKAAAIPEDQMVNWGAVV